MDEIEIILPPIADQTEVLDFSLVALTEAIAKLDEKKLGHGFLGGEFGYGAEWENGVFCIMVRRTFGTRRAGSGYGGTSGSAET